MLNYDEIPPEMRHEEHKLSPEEANAAIEKMTAKLIQAQKDILENGSPFSKIEAGIKDAVKTAEREPGFYWVRYVVPYVAEWDGIEWWLPGISAPYFDKDFTYIADQPIKASIE